jgi:hypothetical protein
MFPPKLSSHLWQAGAGAGRQAGRSSHYISHSIPLALVSKLPPQERQRRQQRRRPCDPWSQYVEGQCHRSFWLSPSSGILDTAPSKPFFFWGRARARYASLRLPRHASRCLSSAASLRPSPPSPSPHQLLRLTTAVAAGLRVAVDFGTVAAAVRTRVQVDLPAAPVAAAAPPG